MVWAADTSTPAGSDTQIQFNNAGVFGGSTDLVWDAINTSITTPRIALTQTMGPAMLIGSSVLLGDSGAPDTLLIGGQSGASDVTYIQFGTFDGNTLGRIGGNPLTYTGDFEAATVAMTVTTVGALGTMTSGTRAFVSDSELVAGGNFGASVTGGGANSAPVWTDGTLWYIG